MKCYFVLFRVILLIAFEWKNLILDEVIELNCHVWIRLPVVEIEFIHNFRKGKRLILDNIQVETLYL